MNGHDVRTTTALRSPTQFAWQCLATDGLPHGLGGAFVPDDAPANDPRCWLCGGETGGVGWPRASLPATFTTPTLAAVPTSGTICQACMALASKATWEAYVVAWNAAYPDATPLKTGHATSWRNYSHLFRPGYHECPTRARWRAILLEPPEPPFLAVIATSGQKHLLFRGQVATDRDWFPVQVEDERIWIEWAGFRQCLMQFEALLALGYSREEIVTGRYQVARVHKQGMAAWRAAETRFRPWREREPGWVQLAAHVAQREETT